jgi:hypothetical protein
VFGPKSRMNKKNSLLVFSFLDRDDMCDASLVNKSWNQLSDETHAVSVSGTLLRRVETGHERGCPVAQDLLRSRRP